MTSTAVIFGGPSPEHDVSILTGLQALRVLHQVGGEAPLALYWSKGGDFFQIPPNLEAGAFVDGVPDGAEQLRLQLGSGGGFRKRGGRLSGDKVLRAQAVVNCCHGGPGEDGTLQAALDLAGIAYTGPTVTGAGLGMDKLAFGAVVAASGLPTLKRELMGESSSLGFPGPYILKPRFGGSSIGIEVVADEATARARLRSNRHLQAGAVVEPYRSDLFDAQVAVRTWPHLQLSAIERPLRSTTSAEFLGYLDKYVGGEGMVSAPRELPARLPDSLVSAIRQAALAVAVLAGIRGIARIDFLTDGEEELYVNEVNTIPGSLARYLWVDPPVPFTQLMSDLVEEAIHSPTHRFSASGADGTVLRSAGSIAAKLA
ncbi:MAG: hypothetical protein M1115_03975 [Actinobacteria bacterium]|nr:hypothetical protein [Actinomycetota bacterium]